MKKRKGQVALEFLMTYGWAFLVIIVVIGAFVYFDVLNPGRDVGGRCTLTAGFYCTAVRADTGNVQIEFRNDLGQTATNVLFEFKERGAESWVSCSGHEATLAAMSTTIATCTYPTEYEDGERIMADLRIQYKTRGSDLEQYSSGGLSYMVVAAGGGGGEDP